MTEHIKTTLDSKTRAPPDPGSPPHPPQVQRAIAGEIEIRAPKNGSEQTVNLPDDLLTMLSSHIAEHTDRRAQQRWLFTGDPGYPPHQNTVAYWWRKTRSAASVGDLRLHDLRRTRGPI